MIRVLRSRFKVVKIGRPPRSIPHVHPSQVSSEATRLHVTSAATRRVPVSFVCMVAGGNEVVPLVSPLCLFEAIMQEDLGGGYTLQQGRCLRNHGDLQNTVGRERAVVGVTDTVPKMGY